MSRSGGTPPCYQEQTQPDFVKSQAKTPDHKTSWFQPPCPRRDGFSSGFVVLGRWMLPNDRKRGKFAEKIGFRPMHKAVGCIATH